MQQPIYEPDASGHDALTRMEYLEVSSFLADQAPRSRARLAHYGDDQ